MIPIIDSAHKSSFCGRAGGEKQTRRSLSLLSSWRCRQEADGTFIRRAFSSWIIMSQSVFKFRYTKRWDKIFLSIQLSPSILLMSHAMSNHSALLVHKWPLNGHSSTVRKKLLIPNDHEGYVNCLWWWQEIHIPPVLRFSSSCHLFSAILASHPSKGTQLLND